MKYVPTRSTYCIWPYGINDADETSILSLAYAELYLVLAHMFRSFKLSLHETTDADMVWDDCFTIMTKGHLKVLIEEMGD